MAIFSNQGAQSKKEKGSQAIQSIFDEEKEK